MVAASLGPTLPALADLTQTSFGQISFLFIARALGYLVGSILGGYLFDRISGHPVMAVTLACLGATLFFTPNIPLLWILTAVISITGLAQGIVDVGGNTLIVWVHGHKVGPFMNGLHLFYGIGTFLAPIIIAQTVLISGNITWGYWIIAAFVLFSALQIITIPSQPIPVKKPGLNSRQTNLLLVTLAAAFLFCYSSMANIFGGWIYSYAVSLELTNETNAAYLTSTFWGAFTIGRLISIPIAVYIKPNTILMGDLVGCLLSVGIILLSPYSIIAIWLGAAGLGVSAASLFPTTISLVERRTEITGKVTSRFVIGSALGAMLPPWIVGQLYETAGPQSVIFSVFVALLAAIAVFAILMRETNVRSLQMRI